MPRETIVDLDTRLKRASCANCSMQRMCMPTGLDDQDIDRIADVVEDRRRVARDDTLYKPGQQFKSLYAVRYGHLKTFQINAAGAAQITGFQMAGEMLGMEAIGAGRHSGETVALEDTEVCEIPFSRLEELLVKVPGYMRHFHRTMSQEITRDQSVMLLLGGMKAEQRFAVFLTNLAARYAARGYSPLEFGLRMSREDIGNYLGLTIESISRLITRFNKLGWVKIDKRQVTILDLETLKAIAGGTSAS